MPATVVLKNGRTRTAVAKKPSGKSKKSNKRLKTGTWKVVAKPVQYNGRYYIPNIKPKKTKIKVKKNKTTKLTVTYKQAKTASKLEVNKMNSKSIALKFKKPKTSTKIKIRYSTGYRAPATAKKGKPAKVSAKAKTVTVKGLKPNQPYSFALFTKVGKKWVGPITVTASTKSTKKDKPSSTFVADPETILLDQQTTVKATEEPNGQVNVKLPGSVSPVIGQAVVLPISKDLPGGFIGVITSINDDGQTVALEQAGVLDAFEHIEVSVPQISKTKTASGEAFAAQDGPERLSASSICSGGGQIVTTSSGNKIDGSFTMQAARPKWYKLWSFDGVNINTNLIFTSRVSIGGSAINGNVSCTAPLPKINRTFMAGPVPMAFSLVPTASLTAQGNINGEFLGAKLEAGFKGKAHIPLMDKKKFSTSVKPVYSFEQYNYGNTAEINAEANLDIGGTMQFGPGVATKFAGATAGIAGSYYPLRAAITGSADATSGYCIETKAGADASLNVFAEAWLGKNKGWKKDAQYTLLDKEWTYASWDNKPNGCNPATVSNGLTRISVSSDDTQANGGSSEPSLSADGRYVAFTSTASNLVPGDTNENHDVFVRDRQTGETTRVSVNSNGGQAESWSLAPTISADGRYVAFASYADDLVPGDTNESQDVFVHDRQTGETTRVSIHSNGTQADHDSWEPSISADGRYIAFTTYAGNLVTNSPSGPQAVFVHDRHTGQTTRVSQRQDGEPADSSAWSPAISADGRYIAFTSGASDLIAGDTNELDDVFVRDRQTGQTARISIDSSGAQANNQSWQPSISADGRYVAFVSHASNLVAGDNNGTADVFVHDHQTGQTTRVNLRSDGSESSGLADEPAISADGRYVVFSAYADDVVPGDTNNDSDVFLHDRQTGQTSRISVSHVGEQLQAQSWRPAISADGHYIVFASFASNLIPGDTNTQEDVFILERP